MSSLIGRVLSWFGFGGRSANDKALMEAGFGAMSRFGSVRKSFEWEREYEQNCHLRAPLSRVATDASLVPWKLYKHQSNGKRKRVTSHKLLDLLAKPCPGKTQMWWMQMLCLYADLDGEWFLGVEVDRDGDPAQLVPIPPSWVIGTPCRANPNYRIRVPGASVLERPAGSVIWHTTPRPADPYGRGVGLASSVDDEVGQLDNMAQYNEGFFGNGCTLGAVLSVENPGSNWERTRDQFTARHAGVANSFRLAVVPGKTSLQSLANTHKDLDFNEGIKTNRDIIRQTVGTPPEIHGQTENSNKATAQAAENLHQAYGILPRLADMCQVFNEFLLPLFEGSEQLELCFENPVKQSEEFRLDRAERLGKSGILTVNEIRQEQGYDPDPNADVYLIPVNMRVIARKDLARFAEAQLQQAEKQAEKQQISDKTQQNNAKNQQDNQKSLPGRSLDQYMQEVSPL